jgi:hypothetical protein
LSQGLVATAKAKPEDPVEFLAHWLIKYSENTVRQKEVSIE